MLETDITKALHGSYYIDLYVRVNGFGCATSSNSSVDLFSSLILFCRDVFGVALDGHWIENVQAK